MAVKQQGKKDTKDVKRRKSEKKPQLAKQKQKKLQSQKLKKCQFCLKRQAAKRSKAGTSGQERKICSPLLFASRILRQMPKVRMEAKARTLVKTMVTDMYNHVAVQVETSLSQKNEPSAISATDVQTALREAMTKELAKHTAEQPPTAPSECT